MKFITAIALLASSVIGQELPITTTDVFVQSGEVSDSSAVVMVRCNNEKDSAVSLSLDKGASVEASQAFMARDYTISFLVKGLSGNTKYSYVATCTPLDGVSPAVTSMNASFMTAPSADDSSALKFVWAADLAGQGWGRNPDFEVTTPSGKTIKGGYVVFETMESLNPQFALFQGDMIYADNNIPAIKAIPDAIGGGNWTNNPSKDFIAVTLDEFRANWKYNFGDDKMQSFLSKTPVFVQWDDHEVTNNWWPGEVMAGKYEAGTAADSLYVNSLQSFYEFNPIMEDSSIYRKQRFGKNVEIFFPDYRSFRDPNPDNSNPDGSAMMGKEQLEWLKQGLLESTATWKIISSHDPIGIVTGGDGDRDSFGQMDPAILGREFEVKELLAFINDNDIHNVVSLTSDVHFTAHVNMDPSRAEGGFKDFKPLNEFVIGPTHSGSFGPNYMDTSFGAHYVYEVGPLTKGFERWANLPPQQSDLQSFGYAEVSEEGVLDIKLMTIAGEVMYEQRLEPATAAPPTVHTKAPKAPKGNKDKEPKAKKAKGPKH